MYFIGYAVDQEEKEGLSVGQACRIRVGPLKGYICRVMAIRYSDITVKLDSQHKILTGSNTNSYDFLYFYVLVFLGSWR